MRTKEQIIEEIEYYTEWVKKSTKQAEYFVDRDKYHTKRINELKQELKEQG